MAIQYEDAIDELFGMVKVVFDDSQWLTLFGYVIDVRWPGVAYATKPDPSKQWARVSQQVVTDGQVSLANTQGKRVFETVGLLYAQLFAPRNTPGAAENSRKVAEAIRDKFRGNSPSNEIWFRNQKIVELPTTQDSTPVNVVITYSFKSLMPEVTEVAILDGGTF